MKLLLLIVMLSLYHSYKPMRSFSKDDAFTDDCKYHEEFDKCGDKCLDWDAECRCGDEKFVVRGSSQYCCVDPSDTCTQERVGNVTNVYCPNGTVVSVEESCNGICYNSFQHSNFIGFYAWYSYEEQNVCVPIEDICQGISLSREDVDICSKQLRCIEDVDYTSKLMKLKNLKEHFYCFNDKKYSNDGKYDVIDRSDEDNIEIATVANIDYAPFTLCYDHSKNNDPGIMCEDKCLVSRSWCTDDFTGDGLIGQVCNKISTRNAKFCSNKPFWSDVPCTVHDQNGSIQTYGHRCTGAMKNCVVPWFTWKYGKTSWSIIKQSCSDKSDQIFPQNITCQQYNEHLLLEHNNIWCNYTEVKTETICTHPERWLQQQDIPDVHNCQDSCKVVGPNCRTCQNSEYFQCNKSGKCIHPDLHCDGHPQCPEAEDEDLETCYQKYLDRKIIDQSATIKCNSSMYPEMKIYATACNDIIECGDGEDEKNCSLNNDSLLVATSFFVLLIFWILRLVVFAKKKFHEKTDFIDLGNESFGTILKKYVTNHNDQKTVQHISSFLLHVLYSKTTFEKNKYCSIFYNSESQIHEDDESEIWVCIRNRMDARVAEMIHDEVNPGLKQAIVDVLERNCITYWMTNILDKLRLNGILRKIIYQFSKAISVELVYIDMFKDCLLTYSIYKLAGGFVSLYEFPLNLTTVLFAFFSATIVLSLLATSLHLTINNPGLIIFTYGKRPLVGIRRKVYHVLVLLLSFLNPIILVNTCQTVSEDLKDEAIENQTSERVIVLAEMYKKFEDIHSQFIRIDLILEIFYQTSAQILLWFYSKTTTKTTSGLEKFLQGNATFFGINFAPETALGLSIVWSLKTCVLSHLSAISSEKRFLGLKSKVVILLCAICSTCRRILGLILFFTPAFGLFDILNHWKAEKIPFRVRLNHAKQFGINPQDRIKLRGLEDAILWTELDRWDYSNVDIPKPPEYNIYTGLTLGETFGLFIALSFVQFMVLGMVKFFTSEKFRDQKEKNYNKMIHLLECLNLSFPYQDWDRENSTVLEFRRKHKEVAMEMLYNLLANFIFSFCKLVPLWYTGIQKYIYRQSFRVKLFRSPFPCMHHFYCFILYLNFSLIFPLLQ